MGMQPFIPQAGEPIPAGILDDILAGKLPNYVDFEVRDRLGRLKQAGRSVNLRCTDGGDWQADVMGNSTQPAPANYIALTTNTGAPAAGDTVLTGEITTGGLARALGTYSHTNDTAVYKISKTFTSSATHTAVHKAGLFNAASGAVMVFETVLSSDVSLVSGDTLTIEWTVNI